MRARSILAMIIVASTVPNATPLHAQRRGAPAPQLPNPGTLLRAGRATNSIGTESAGPSMIGFVRAAVQDARGGIYVLDDANFSLRAFDRSGKLLSTVGRNGRGPGDLSQPNGLAHDGDSLLYVSDRNNGISVYSAASGQLRFKRALFTDARPGGVCAARGRVYVAMAVGDQLLHEISTNGRVLRSFAPLFGADSVEVIRNLGRLDAGGFLRCDPDDGSVTVVYLDGDTRHFDANGTQKWRSKLTNFAGATVKAGERGGYSVFFAKQELNSVMTIGPHVTVQALDVKHGPRQQPMSGPRLRREAVSVTTWVLSRATGAVVAHGKWGPTIADVRGGVALAHEEDPFPRVWAFPLAPTSR